MAIFSDDKITPFMGERGVCSGESLRGFKAIGIYLAVKGFKGGGEDRPGVQVNTNIGGPKAHDVFVEEFLRTRDEAIKHRAVHDCGKDWLRDEGHCSIFLGWVAS